mgnify:CR=1 FL=1
MKRANIILVFYFILVSLSIQAQVEKETKFNISVFGGIGYGIVENDFDPDYNLNSNQGEIHINYSINRKFGIVDIVEEDVYKGWTFGGQLGIGLVYQINDNFSCGFQYYGQSDFSKLELNNTQNVTKKQRINNLNSIGLFFLFDL